MDYWLAAAFTEFVNGCISGLGGGSMLGAASGVATASTGLWAGMDWLVHAAIALGTTVAAAISHGFKTVIVWHKANPFPNPWPPPTGNTTQPFSTP